MALARCLRGMEPVMVRYERPSCGSRSLSQSSVEVYWLNTSCARCDKRAAKGRRGEQAEGKAGGHAGVEEAEIEQLQRGAQRAHRPGAFLSSPHIKCSEQQAQSLHIV